MRLTPLEKAEKEIDIAAEVARLAKMTVPELLARHVELSNDPDFAMEFAMAMYFPG